MKLRVKSYSRNKLTDAKPRNAVVVGTSGGNNGRLGGSWGRGVYRSKRLHDRNNNNFSRVKLGGKRTDRKGERTDKEADKIRIPSQREPSRHVRAGSS